MSGQHPSKWASGRWPLARGRAEGGGPRPPAPPSRLARAGWELAEHFPSREAEDSIASAPWEGLSGVFLVVSLLRFPFPASLGYSRRAWEAAVMCLFVCPSAEHPAGPGEVGHGCSWQGGTSQVLWGLPQGRPVVALLFQPFMAAVTPGVSRAVVSFQEFLEDALSVFHGAKPSPELCCRGLVSLGGVGDKGPTLGTESCLLGPPRCLAAGCGACSCQIQVGSSGLGWEGLKCRTRDAL